MPTPLRVRRLASPSRSTVAFGPGFLAAVTARRRTGVPADVILRGEVVRYFNGLSPKYDP